MPWTSMDMFHHQNEASEASYLFYVIFIIFHHQNESSYKML